MTFTFTQHILTKHTRYSSRSGTSAGLLPWEQQDSRASTSVVPGTRRVAVTYVRGGGHHAPQLVSPDEDSFAVPIVEVPTEHLALTREVNLDRSCEKTFALTGHLSSTTVSTSFRAKNHCNFLYNRTDVAFTASPTGLSLSTSIPAATASSQYAASYAATAIWIRAAASNTALPSTTIRHDTSFSIDPSQPPRGGWQGKRRGLHESTRAATNLQCV